MSDEPLGFSSRSGISQPQYPPVFVMNVYYTGIGIARSLYGRGVRIYGLSSERTAPGVRSRLFDGIYQVPNGRDEPDLLCQRLIEIRREYADSAVLFPTRDFDVLFLHEYREKIAPIYRIPQPEGDPILRVMDKMELAALARCQEIPTPATCVCRSLDEITQAMRVLRFPIVVKPRFAYEWRRKGVWNKVGSRKAILVESPCQMQAQHSHLVDISREVLLQEYIPGADSDIVVCCCYVDRKGELVAYFTARKLRQSPVLFGTGCVVEAAHIPDIVTPSVTLLRAAGYSGLAEVEFKYDKHSGRFFLIEINPRHWDQHELGNLVGVNLSWIAYQDILGLSPARVTPSYRVSVNCRWIAENEFVMSTIQDAYREMVSLRGSNPRLGDYLQVLSRSWRNWYCLPRGKRVFAVLRIRDPIPGILMFYRLAVELLRAFYGMICLSFEKRAAKVEQDAKAQRSQMPRPERKP